MQTVGIQAFEDAEEDEALGVVDVLIHFPRDVSWGTRSAVMGIAALRRAGCQSDKAGGNMLHAVLHKSLVMTGESDVSACLSLALSAK